MADERNNPDLERNAGQQGDRGGQQSPGRNPNEGQSSSQRDENQGKDQGLGKGQQGNRDLNEGGFEKGGSDRGDQRNQDL